MEGRLLADRLAATAIDRPVFVAGLARAGTTIVLRTLSEASEFATHRYADFPFLFTPYAWARLRRLMPARRQEPRERMHRDGIMVTAESPEAMEEVLWMAFFPRLHDPAVSNVLDEDER
ncbi:MAG TPA: sulfotransferase, partial [Acetobacteraceae bacterium]|nr:sulfotransferase [Acetobacteraceae bacterium]